MSKFTPIDEALHAYMVERGSREDGALAAVREETAALGDIAVMQIAPDQGALMRLLMIMVRGERPGLAVEVGTFTGYSAICLARGLGEGGRLVACELDPERAATASTNFERAGLADRIDVRVGPAGDTLVELIEEAQRDGDVYDLAFIDADKPGYDSYYESALQLLRPGGLIVLDNVLQDGRVLEPGDTESAIAIDALNAKVRDDDRVEIAMVGVADGLTFALKK
jgi:predicted O-methyltransferase YrrM